MPRGADVSRGITRVALDAAGGAQLGGGQAWFKVDGQAVVVAGDAVAGHGIVPHAAPVMTAGGGWLTLGGVPVVAEGDVATCGHVTSGAGWFRIE